MKALKIALLLIALSLVGCASDPPEIDQTLISPSIWTFHGEENLMVLLYPDTVRSYRVEKTGRHSSPTRTTFNEDGEPADYRITERGPDLTQEQIERLRPLFLDLRGYYYLRSRQFHEYEPPRDPDDFGADVFGRGCGWTPGFLMQFERDGHVVGVVICFRCSDWAFQANAERYGSDWFAMDTRAMGIQRLLRWTAVELFPELHELIPRDQ